MDDEQPIQLGKWYGLLIFAAGSILTAIMSALEFGFGLMGGRSVGPMGGRSPGLGITTLRDRCSRLLDLFQARTGLGTPGLVITIGGSE